MENVLQLNSDEKNVLESVYGRQLFGGVGYNPRKLEAIKNLTAQEKKFFADKNFVSPHFYIQILYKVSGNVGPMKFNVAVNRTLNENENLRANFCNVGTRTIKVINPAGMLKPEIIFRNIMQTDKDELDDEFRKILEADMRREFDLRHDLLIRFAVFKTSETEFAVLVTVAQLIADSFDSKKFFSLVTDGATVTPSEKIRPSAHELGQYINLDAIREYWSKVLHDPPPIAKLPYERKFSGAYRQKAHLMKIPADILSDMRGRAQSNRMMLTAFLQSAWGFMLQTVNHRQDCLFCQILSSAKNSKSLSLIPVRIICETDLTVEKIVRQQFRQLIISQPYSNFDWEDLDTLTEHKKLFEHFLSFKEFQSSELNFSTTKAEPHGKIILQNSWDAQGMKLGAYFRYSEKNLAITFLYDEKQFIIDGVEKLCALFNLIMKQMLVDWNAKFPVFRQNLDKRIKMLRDAEKIPQEDARIKIRNYLSQLPILQGRYEGTIHLFDERSTIETFYEGDRISGDVLEEKFIFVVSGKLARSVDTGDGWYNPIDIVGKNAFINPTNFLEKRRLTLSAEVLTEQAHLLMIPHNVLLDAFNKNSEIAHGLIQYALSQMEKYQALWLQS